MKKISKKLMGRLHDRLSASESNFWKMGDTTTGSRGRPHTLIDNGASILGVAHLDSACSYAKPKFTGQTVVSPQLDDRLGVWVMLDLLPALGAVPFDVLLTTDEEIGASTASDFLPSKDYNWVFSFDRRGLDTVMYEYEDQETAALVESFGLKVGGGSFSDICYLDHLGVKGFNFGTGYHAEHTFKCYANLRDTLQNSIKFMEFASDLRDTKLPHIPKPKKSSYSSMARNWNYWTNDSHNSVSYHEVPFDCDSCQKALDLDWNFCPFCGTDIYGPEKVEDIASDDWIIR